MSESFDPFAGQELQLTVTSTAPQQEIWMAIALGGPEASLAFNESLTLEILGPVDGGRLREAWNQVARRHEALRTSFTADGLTLCVEKTVRLDWRTDDWSSLAPEVRKAKKRDLLNQEVGVPFDLVNGPVFRTFWARETSDRSVFVLTAHHLFCDGYSAGVLLNELQQTYQALSEGRTPDLGPAPRFSDYAVALNQALQGPETADAERFWVKALGDRPEALDLPTDLRRPAERGFSADRVDIVFSLELLAALRSMGKKTGLSLSTSFLAAFNAFLCRLSGQNSFVIAMPSAGQTLPGFDGLVGHCVNTLPVPVRIDPAAPYLDHAKAIKAAVLDGLENQVLSFGNLLQKLQLPRDPSRIPLVPILFNVDTPMKLGPLGTSPLRMSTNPRRSEAFEIFINATETDEGFVLETTFNTGLFLKETIVRWMEDFRTLLETVVETPATPVQDLPVLSPASRSLLFDVWNRTQRPLPAAPTALTLFEVQAARTPDALAARDGAGSLTYRELDERANHLAHRLRDFGVAEGDLVGVCADRSTRVLAALLAIWKAGAAYVPLDPDYPKNRLEGIIEDANVRVLMTEGPLADVFPGASLERLWIDQEGGRSQTAPARNDRPDRLAYVLHTSGSTGKPKGVQIDHGNLVNFLASMAVDIDVGPRDIVVAVTTLSFDIAGLELYLPLSVGGQTVIAAREDALDGPRLARLLGATSATVLQATPATWQLLVEADWRGPSGFKALCGGEALPPELARELVERCGAVWNVYGPTETTIWSTFDRLSAVGPVSIGRPLANTTVYVVDQRLQPVPIGAAGELLIGGAGVSRGYWNRPDLTAERFIPDPYSAVLGAKLYRTGDVCRFGPDGRLYFYRRNDSQVKVRGFRIELGEIETALGAAAGVLQAVAVVRTFGEGDVRLVAYVVARSGTTLDAGTLKAGLTTVVPPYMVPQHLVILDQFPLTPNGKIDRKALPSPTDEGTGAGDVVSPRTPVEAAIATIWADLLRVARVGATSNFFDLGGHSMLAARMLARVREELGVELPMRVVFQAQTVEGLAARVEASQLSSPQSSPGGPREELEF